MSEAAPAPAPAERDLQLGRWLETIIASPTLSQLVHELHLLPRLKPRRGPTPPSAAKIVWKNGAVDYFGEPNPTGVLRWTVLPGSLLAVAHELAMSHPDRRPKA